MLSHVCVRSVRGVRALIARAAGVVVSVYSGQGWLASRARKKSGGGENERKKREISGASRKLRVWAIKKSAELISPG